MAAGSTMAPRCLRPANSKPELMLLVNGARFDLGKSFGGCFGTRLEKDSYR